MLNLKIVSFSEREIIFDNGYKLYSDHTFDCWEDHFLDFSSIEGQDFENLKFDIDVEGKFFERVPDYGILLKPVNGWPIRIPGYGHNNGYYSSDICLQIIDNNEKVIQSFDVSECQVYNY